MAEHESFFSDSEPQEAEEQEGERIVENEEFEQDEESIEELQEDIDELEANVTKDIEEVEGELEEVSNVIEELPEENQGAFYDRLQRLRDQLSTGVSRLNESLSEINRQLHTDMQTGELKRAFGIPTVDRYIRAQREEYWTQVEFLQKNMEQYMSRVKELAQEKGTWDNEHLAHVEEIMQKITNVPLFHVTDRLIFDDLKSYESVKSQEEEHDRSSSTQTYQEDIDLGREKYVYFSWGSFYLGKYGADAHESSDLNAIVLDGTEIHNPQCVVQDQHLYRALGLSEKRRMSTDHEEDTSNIYEPLAESTLLGSDYVRMLSTAMATGVWKDLEEGPFPEVMFRDNVKKEQIQAYIQNEPENKLATEEEKEETLQQLQAFQDSTIKDSICLPSELFFQLQPFMKGESLWDRALDGDTDDSWVEWLKEYVQNHEER